MSNEETQFYSIWYGDCEQWSGMVEIDRHVASRFAPFALTKEEALAALAKIQNGTNSYVSHQVKPLPKDQATTPHPSRKEAPMPDTSDWNVWYDGKAWTGKILVDGHIQDWRAPFPLTKTEAEEIARINGLHPPLYVVKQLLPGDARTPHPTRKTEPIKATCYSIQDSFTGTWAVLPYEGVEQDPSKPFALTAPIAEEWESHFTAETNNRFSVKPIPSDHLTTSPPSTVKTPSRERPTIASYLLGDTVYLHSQNDDLYQCDMGQTIKATIIGRTDKHAILGWRANETQFPSIAAPRSKGAGTYVADEAEYVRACTVPLGWSVADKPKQKATSLADARPGSDVALYVDANKEIVQFQTDHRINGKVLGVKDDVVYVGWKSNAAKPRTYITGMKTEHGFWIEGVESYSRYVILKDTHPCHSVIAASPQATPTSVKVETQPVEVKHTAPPKQDAQLPIYKHGDYVLWNGIDGRLIIDDANAWVLVETDEPWAFCAGSFGSFVPESSQKFVREAIKEFGFVLRNNTTNMSQTLVASDLINRSQLRFVRHNESKIEPTIEPSKEEESKPETTGSIMAMAAGAAIGAFISAAGKAAGATSGVRVEDGVMGEVLEELSEVAKEATA